MIEMFKVIITKKMKNEKFKIVTVVLVFFSMITFANEPANIGGKVIDKQNSQPISNALVVLYSADSESVISVTYADENGNFNFEVDNTLNYVLQIQSLGYESSVAEKIELNSEDGFYNTGTIEMNNNDIQLDEIVVTAKREFKLTPEVVAKK